MNLEINKRNDSQRMTTTAALTLIVVAIFLFGLVIYQLGFFNRSSRSTIAISAQNILVEAKDMRFGATEIVVQAGQPLSLVLDNHDYFAHSFDVDSLNLHIEMAPNSQSSIFFTPQEAGRYTIYCDIPGHREAGMVSTLIVE